MNTMVGLKVLGSLNAAIDLSLKVVTNVMSRGIEFFKSCLNRIASISQQNLPKVSDENAKNWKICSIHSGLPRA